jgi:hypothetical protein
MENRYGWSGNPVPVAVPRESGSVGSSIAFPFGRRVESDEKASLALALFREGRTVNSTVNATRQKSSLAEADQRYAAVQKARHVVEATAKRHLRL